MAKFVVGKGLDNYIAYLQQINLLSSDMVGEAVYDMAKVVADKVRANIEALPAVSNAANIATYKQGISRLSEPEKQGLLDGFGVSSIQDNDGYVNVKLGFDGYNSVKTKKYPNGQPNALIARVTNSGSSYRQKTRFVDKAVSTTRKQAEEAGQAKIDEKIRAVKT